MTFLSTSAPARPFGLALLCSLVLAALLPAAAAAQSSPEELEAQIAEARGTYDSQRGALEGDYAHYHGYLEDVAALEAEREAAGPFASDEAVRNARRQAREMAVELQRESETLYTLTAEIRALQSELFEALDDRRVGLEQALAVAGPEERGRIIAELAIISDTRARHLEPLPAPPQVELDAILLGLEEETMPEELEATAAELSDHERRLEEHLNELERHILQIELRERDREFRSEVSLFEEGQNSGRREERASASAGGSQTDTTNNRGSSDTPVGGVNDEVQSGGPGDNGGTPNDSDSAEGGGAAPGVDDDNLATGGAGGGEPAAPSADPDGEFDGTDDGRSADEGDGFSGVPEQPTGGSVDISDTPGFEPTPTPPSLAGVGLERPVHDPSQDVIWFNSSEERADRADQPLRSRLEQLRDERENTAETLEEIRDERRRLLERVRELEEIEGF